MRRYFFLIGFLLAASLQAGITISLPGFPKALLHYAGADEPSAALDFYLFEPLVRMSLQDRHPMPILAERWTISPDHRVYTFFLRAEARFSDGTPVTADDVKFTWEAIQDGKNPFPIWKSIFANVKSVTVKGPLTIEFVVANPQYGDFEHFDELLILPRHATPDLTSPYPRQLVGSGPYVLGETKLGDSVTLLRNPRYWGKQTSAFDRMVWKAVPDPQSEIELLRQGALDVAYFWVARIWSTQTDDALFRAGKLKKLAIETRMPSGLSGIAWNLRRPLFSDPRVRLALAHLLDRPRLLHTLFYDAYRVSTGVVAPDSPYHDPQNQPVAFDPKAARSLLAQAGWNTPGSDGVLTKNGQRFSFEILAKDQTAERFLTVYQESLRKQGIEMRIRVSDWTSTLRRMDARDFDGVLVYRSRDMEPDELGTTWGSASAKIAGSENVTGFADPEVDRWTEELARTFDKQKRITLGRRIDRRIAEAAPMAFLWEPSTYRYAYWDRFEFDHIPRYAHWYEIFGEWRERPSKAGR